VSGTVAAGNEPALWRLEAWLETTRVPALGARPAGYGGPVVHWWRDSVQYTGPGFDWRYEGIIYGYLALHERTGERRWLDKAIRAGDDLVAAQLPNGNFMCSGFEQNPSTAGTPHEAAADSALLALALALLTRTAPGWERYATAARRNIEAFYVGRLWDGEVRLFRDDPARPSFVPNKACALVEALFQMADLTGEDVWLERYARPTLDAVLRHQVRARGNVLDGAIAQNSFGRQVVEKYFPYYVARCVPALAEAGARLAQARYLDAAVAAGQFIMRVRDVDGGFPQVLYPRGRVNQQPRWIAATGDILRALALLRPHGHYADPRPTHDRLLDSQLPCGAFKTADGLPTRVVGWNDKTFRYLAPLAP
jgi:uncharacterized protein YyaL (SSP411 family)